LSVLTLKAISESNDFEEPDYVYKIIILGNAFTGKTSWLCSVIDPEYIINTAQTIGTAFEAVYAKYHEDIFALIFWDCSGQKRFRKIINDFLKGADGVVVFYSVSDLESFKDLNEWFDLLKNHSDYEKFRDNICVVGNKVDLTPFWEVSKDAKEIFKDAKRTIKPTYDLEKVNAKIESLEHFGHFRISCMTRENVLLPVHSLIKQLKIIDSFNPDDVHFVRKKDISQEERRNKLS